MDFTKQNISGAKDKMNNMKYEVANQLGINLKQGYNGDLTSKEAGYVGGYMVKNICPVRKTKFERKSRILDGHKMVVTYVAGVVV